MRIDKNAKRLRRKMSIRHKIYGTAERPRLTVFKSNKNIFAQIIDDDKGITLCSSSTVEKDFKGDKAVNKCNKVYAEKVGEMIGKRALEKNIKSIVFDRNGYNYHGRIKVLADAARKAGLEF